MVTRIVEIGGTPYVVREDGSRKRAEQIYMLSTNTMPTEDVENATMIFIMDWNELDDVAKTTLGSQIHIFDAENVRWLPM